MKWDGDYPVQKSPSEKEPDAQPVGQVVRDHSRASNQDTRLCSVTTADFAHGTSSLGRISIERDVDLSPSCTEPPYQRAEVFSQSLEEANLEKARKRDLRRHILGRRITRVVLSIAAAIGVGGVSTLWASYPFIPVPDAFVSISLSVCAFSLAYATLPRPRNVLEELRSLDLSGVGMSAEDVSDLIREARARTQDLHELSRSTELDASVRTLILDLANTADVIIDDLKESPSGITRSKTFLRHYLPEAVKAVRKYTRLQERSGNNDDVQEILREFEGSLNEIRDLFRGQRDANLRDEAMSLSIDLNVMRAIGGNERSKNAQA